jgi:hypothetical protein
VAAAAYTLLKMKKTTVKVSLMHMAAPSLQMRLKAV